MRASPNPFRLDIADVNGDGHLDVTYADSQSGEVVLLLGAGSGAVSEFEMPMQLAGAAVVLFAGARLLGREHRWEIPMMVPLFVGFVTALLFGDVVGVVL